jgi:hypothetical protein
MTKPSDFPPAVLPLTGSEVIPIIQDNEDRQTTPDDLLASAIATALGSDVIMAGTLASIPVAGAAGRLYVSEVGVFRDNGSAWELATTDAFGSGPSHVPPSVDDYEWIVGSGGRSASSTHTLTALGREVWSPIWLPAASYDRITVFVTTGATATWRLGLCPMSSSNAVPSGAPIIDAGTVNMSGAAGQRNITINLVVATPGWYWTQIKVEAYTGTPATSCFSGTPPFRGWPIQAVSASGTRSFSGLVFNGNGAGGALTAAPALTGDAATGLSYTEDTPCVYFRRA